MWFLSQTPTRIGLGAHPDRAAAQRWLAARIESPVDAIGIFHAEPREFLLYGQVEDGRFFLGVLRRGLRTGQLLFQGQLVRDGKEWFAEGLLRSGRHQRINLTLMGLVAFALSLVLPIAHLQRDGVDGALTSGGLALLFAPLVVTAFYLLVLRGIQRGGLADLRTLRETLEQEIAR